MAELADAVDSKSTDLTVLSVRLRSWAPDKIPRQNRGIFISSLADPALVTTNSLSFNYLRQLATLPRATRYRHWAQGNDAHDATEEPHMRAVVTCLISTALVLSMTGCGKTKTTPKATVNQAATEKITAAIAEQQVVEEQVRAERRITQEATKLASVNSICPVTGGFVDPAIAPIPVEILIVQPAETIMVGVANAAAGDAVRRDPGRYAAAAQSNKQARAYTSVGP